LERTIGSICRAIAVKIAEGQDNSTDNRTIIVTPEMLEDILGVSTHDAIVPPSQSHSQTLTSRLGMRLDLVLSYLCGCVGEMENSQLAVVVHGLYISLYGMLWTMNSNVPV